MKFKCLKQTKQERQLSQAERLKLRQEELDIQRKSLNQNKPTSHVLIRPHSAAVLSNKQQIYQQNSSIQIDGISLMPNKTSKKFINLQNNQPQGQQQQNCFMNGGFLKSAKTLKRNNGKIGLGSKSQKKTHMVVPITQKVSEVNINLGDQSELQGRTLTAFAENLNDTHTKPRTSQRSMAGQTENEKNITNDKMERKKYLESCRSYVSSHHTKNKVRNFDLESFDRQDSLHIDQDQGISVELIDK